MEPKNQEINLLKMRILGIVEHRGISNLETVARHANIARLTADKYLIQLIDEGKIREMSIGNNRLFVREGSAISLPTGNVENHPANAQHDQIENITIISSGE